MDHFLVDYLRLRDSLATRPIDCGGRASWQHRAAILWTLLQGSHTTQLLQAFVDTHLIDLGLVVSCRRVHSTLQQSSLLSPCHLFSQQFLSFEVLLNHFILLQLLLLLLLREVRQNPRQIQIRNVRRYFVYRPTSSSSCMALTSLFCLVNVVDFLEDVHVILCCVLLQLNKTVRALTGIDERHHSSNWNSILGVCTRFIYSFFMDDRLDRIVQINRHTLNIVGAFSWMLVFDAMIDIHFVLVNSIASILGTVRVICMIFRLLKRSD